MISTGVEVASVPPAALVSPPAADIGFNKELAGVEAIGDAELAGAGPAPLEPQGVMGLFPGKASKDPTINSLMGDTMLQEVEGSLSPPMRPGHLSIPESPASQLSMIC